MYWVISYKPFMPFKSSISMPPQFHAQLPQLDALLVFNLGSPLGTTTSGFLSTSLYSSEAGDSVIVPSHIVTENGFILTAYSY